jgi:hypothetical protein
MSSQVEASFFWRNFASCGGGGKAIATHTKDFFGGKMAEIRHFFWIIILKSPHLDNRFQPIAKYIFGFSTQKIYFPL